MLALVNSPQLHRLVKGVSLRERLQGSLEAREVRVPEAQENATNQL